MKKYNLDAEEIELLNSIEAGEWTSVDNVQEEILNHQQMAKNTLKKGQKC